jgi:hypothetical protein
MRKNTVYFIIVLLFINVTTYLYWPNQSIREKRDFDATVLLYPSKSINKTIVVMHECIYGYGNCMYTFLNSMAVAVLVDGYLFVNWRRIGEFISVKDNADITLTLQARDYIHPDKNVTFNLPFETSNSFAVKKNPGTFYQNMSLDCDVYNVVGYGPVFFELLANSSHYNKLITSGFVSNKTIENAKLAALQTSNDEKVAGLYQIGFEFARHVLNNIWRPNESIQEKIDTFFKEHFEGFYVIGLQMRSQFLDHIGSDIDCFIKCALQLEQSKSNETTGKQGFKWFLSADNEHYFSIFRSNYSNRVALAEGKIGHIINGEGFERGIIDNELLSRCDDLIITGGSTFGFLAAMRMGKMPMFVNGQRGLTSCQSMSFTNYPTRPEGYAVI